MPDLNSTHLKSADYDDDSETLLIEFRSGGKYEYEGVPRDVYDGLIDSPTPGDYFRKRIKPEYRGERVS